MWIIFSHTHLHSQMAFSEAAFHFLVFRETSKTWTSKLVGLTRPPMLDFPLN